MRKTLSVLAISAALLMPVFALAYTDPSLNTIEDGQGITLSSIEGIIQDGINSGELQEIDARLLSWQLVALVEVTLRPYSRRILGNTQQMSDFVITMFFDGISAWSSKQTVDSKN